MADSLLDNYNPLYDVHLRQYFALPHMQKHLRNIGLLQGDDNEDCDDETQLYARHHAMMDLMLRNRETQLAKLADVQKKLDAAEKVEICRKIRSGATSPESHRRSKPSRSLSRGRFSASKRQRRSSTSTDDKDLIKKIETENEEPQTGDPHYVYNRLSACVGKYRYLHKLDDDTLSAYMEQLRRQLNKLERFREVSFGPHSVARHQSEPHVSWFFRRRSLPSLSDSEQANALHEPLRSVQSLKFRTRLGKSTSPRKLNESHDSRATYPLTGKRRRNSESTRLPPIGRNGNSGPSSGSSGAPKVPPKNRTVASKRRSNSRKRDEPVRMQKIKPKDQTTDTLPALAVVGISALAGGASAVAAAGLSSSMNPATPLTIPQLRGLPSEQLQQPEGDIKNELVVTGEEESSRDQNDEQLPSSTPLLAEDEFAVKTTDTVNDREEWKEETKLDDSVQQQKTSEEQIVLQELYDAQNDEKSEQQLDNEAFESEAVKESYDAQNNESSEKQFDNEAFESEAVTEPYDTQNNETSEKELGAEAYESEAIKAESSSQGAQVSVSDQNETVFGDEAVEGEKGKIEVQPQQTLEDNIETSEMQPESASLEPEMYEVEAKLGGKPLQAVLHQPLLESPDMKSEQLEEQPSSPDERYSTEEQYRTVYEETESYSSPHEDPIAAEDFESNYGGTTPNASLELSHDDENAGDIVAISQENADEEKMKETECIEEQQVEHEEISKPESVIPPTEGLSEVTDEPKTTVETQATLAETSVDEKLSEQSDNKDIGSISEYSEKRQASEEAELKQEPENVNGAADSAQIQNGPARSVGADETQEISDDLGATEDPRKEKEADQISRGSLNNDSMQEELISSPAPAESPTKVQEAEDEQSTEAGPTAASPASLGSTEHITEKTEPSFPDMAQQSVIGEEISKVEGAPDGTSWKMKEGNRNGSDEDVQDHLKSAAGDENIQQPEIHACKSEDDAENAVQTVTSEVCEEDEGQAEDVNITEASAMRRKRSASFEEHIINVSEQLPPQVRGDETNSPETVKGAEQPSTDTEASSLCLSSRSNGMTAEQDSRADENGATPGASEVSQSEETRGGTSSKVVEANGRNQEEEKSQTEAIGSNEMETSEASKNADEEVEEASHPDVFVTESSRLSQEENQQQPSTALSDSHSSEQISSSAPQISENLQMKQAESEPNPLFECTNGKDTAEAETNLAEATADTCRSSPHLQSSDVEGKQKISGNETQISDAQPYSGDQASYHSVQESHVTTGEYDDHSVNEDQRVPPTVASEQTSQLGAESSHVEGSTVIDPELAVEKAQGDVASETLSEIESQKERNLFDENANHPDTVNGEQSQQILGNKTNGNITYKSDEEKMQHNGQQSSPLQKPSSTFFEGSDGDSKDVGGGEDETEAATLMHQTIEAEHQTSV